ncbi:MAG: biopolymer transporter ExbD [Bdellovibrionales bacterium]
MKVRSMRQRIDDASFDLNLAPMLDMMVALVPFLLLSIAFVRLVVIETKVPQVVAEAVEQDKNNKDKKMRLIAHIDTDKLKLKYMKNGKTVKNFSFKKDNTKNYLGKFRKELVGIKKINPMHFSLEIRPADAVAYNEIVEVIDEARYLKNEDPVIEILDKKTNTKVPTKLLLPNVFFANVVEG